MVSTSAITIGRPACEATDAPSEFGVLGSNALDSDLWCARPARQRRLCCYAARCMSDGVIDAVSLHWFVEDFAGREVLDLALRWLLATAPAVCATDASDRTVVYGERAALSLEHEWINARFASGLVLRAATPIDVERSLFNERFDVVTGLLRSTHFGQSTGLDRGSPVGGGPVGGGSGQGPAEARVFAYAPARRKS
jgi:hypothetical protein